MCPRNIGKGRTLGIEDGLTYGRTRSFTEFRSVNISSVPHLSVTYQPHSPPYHFFKVVLSLDGFCMNALEMAPEVVKAGPRLLLRFASLHVATISLCGLRLCHGRWMFALGVPIQVICRTESLGPCTTRIPAHKRLRVAQVMLPMNS